MEALKCLSCGNPSLNRVSDDEYVCPSCGTRLKDNSSKKIVMIQQGWVCASCGFNNEPQSMFCVQCGKKLVKYCENCGNAAQLPSTVCPKCGTNKFLSLNNFRMIVSDVFLIKGRGVAVSGSIMQGLINVGDNVYIERNGKVSQFPVVEINMRHKNFQSAKEGDNAGLLIRGATKEDILVGDALIN